MYKLLLVDDEPKILEGMKRTLNWSQYGICQIETALTYEGAIEKALEISPDIGLFDVCIGDRHGYDIVNALKSAHLSTVSVMVSGYSEFSFAQKAIRCGARDYLLKPLEREKLQPVIETIIVQDLHGTLKKDNSSEQQIDPVLGLPYETLSNLTNRIIAIVKTQYRQNINLKSIAEKFKMNSTYLGQIFLKETQMKYSDYLMTYRLHRAHDMILNTNEKISCIASQVGFVNTNYFYTNFRSCFGVSPTALR